MTPADSTARQPNPAAIEAWKDQRFGMFIHWGPCSLKATEISWTRKGEQRDMKEPRVRAMRVPAEEYDNLYKQFNPVKFNADEWVGIAKDAGMKYIVLIAKHCDGFCMFESQLTDYKITKTPFGRDVTAELAAACQKAGMKFGVYYSPPDWHHPDFCTANHARYIEYMHGQVKELLTHYGPVFELWFDRTGGVNNPETWDCPRLFKMIRELQPNVMINSRCAGTPNSRQWGDFATPEQNVGGFKMDWPWESCMTTSAHDHWSWGGEEDRAKDLATCLNFLIGCAGNDGNLLLNVGPTPLGEIAPEQREVILGMGRWLKQYGESIYGTRGGPYKPGGYSEVKQPKRVVKLPGYVSTRTGRTVYLHILKAPAGALVLPPLPAKIVKSSLLTGGKVVVNQTEKGVSIEIPTADIKPIDTIVKLELDHDALTLAPIQAVGAKK